MSDNGRIIDRRETKKRKYEQEPDFAPSQSKEKYTRDDYTVGWICPLEVELIAALEMLDEEHEKQPQPSTDHNVYHLGSISGHNVVIAGMWQAGNNAAATVVTQMRSTFQNIRFGLLVGIGGGVPVMTDNGMVRLGHVVVSKPVGLYSGAIQYDRGKAEAGIFHRTGALAPPPPVLLHAAQALGAQRARAERDPLLKNLQRIDTTRPGLRRFEFPGFEQDYLFPADYKHLGRGLSCDECDCDSTRRLKRIATENNEWIVIHRGTIASGELVLKDGIKRDRLGQEYGVLCFEMEAAGVLSDFPCLVIRGISDYCDSHKNDQWHGFAAASAAAYARQLFCYMPKDQVKQQSVVPVTDPGVKRIVKRSDDQERQKITEWLSSMNYATFQADFLNRRQEGTGEWLLETAEFRQWENQTGTTLFCPGIPGAGKTVITSIVISHLLDKCRIDENIGIAYIYCNYRDQHEQNLDNILSNILKQWIQPLYQTPEDLITLYKHHERHRTRPRRDEILEMLGVVASVYFHCFIIIDALDECPESDGTRDHLISHILDLQRKFNISFFATSRFIPEVTAKFEMFPSVQISASDQDVKRYVEGRVSQLSNCVRRDIGLQRLVVFEIVKAVNGMFLLAKLFIDSLRGKSSTRGIKTALGKLPTESNSYDHAYQKAMERIERQISDQTQLAKRLLSWVTCAKRSLTLTEAQHALAVEVNETCFDEENLPDSEDMISACAGLITYNEHSHVIALVHYTAQEYFEKTWKLWFPDAQGDIGRTCVTYLSYDVFESGSCDGHETFHERLREYPLYDYAAQNWGYHARIQPLEQLLLFNLLGNDRKVSACTQAKTWPTFDWAFDDLPTRTTALHLVAEFGLEHEAEVLIQNGYKIDQMTSRGETPLSKAVQNGHEDLARLLIKHGANPNFKGCDFNMTLVNLAVYHGHESPVEFLLGIGADPNVTDKNKISSLSYAAERGLEEAARLLLEAGADINSRNRFDGKTPLSRAAKGGHLGVVRLLVGRGAELNPRTAGFLESRGRTSLSLAAGEGHSEVVELLLGQNIDPNTLDDEGHTPLLYAARYGRQDVVKVLLGHKVDPNIPDKKDQTPLSYAAQFGHQDVAKLLLGHKVDPDFPDKGCKTPLSHAAEKGHIEVVRLLLTAGANVNPMHESERQVFAPVEWAAMESQLVGYKSTGSKPIAPKLKVPLKMRNYGDGYRRRLCPLLAAIECGNLEMAKLLLQSGANPYFKTRLGETPLSLAAKKGSQGMLHLLIEHDVRTDPNATHETSLLWASKNGHLSMVQALLEKGVGINSRCPQSGDTPLSNAAMKGHKRIVEWLIAEKADLESEDFGGRTALSKAAKGGDEGTIMLLLEQGANFKHRDFTGQTPLAYAIENRNDTVARVLLDRDPTLFYSQDSFGRIPLLMAAEWGRKAMIDLGVDEGIENISDIVQTGIEAVTQTLHSLSDSILLEKGEVLMPWAAANGHTPVVEVLLKRNIGYLCEDEDCSVPPALAIKNRHMGIIKVFLEKGLDPNFQDKAGRNLLWWAFEGGDDAVIHLLLQHGADPNTKIKRVRRRIVSPPIISHQPALFIAAQSGLEKTVQLLLQLGADQSYTMHRSEAEAMDHGDKLERISALSLAVHERHVNIVEKLLDKGVDNDVCHTSLFLAMELRDEQLISLLLRKGIRGNWAIADYGNELLFQAALIGRADVVEMLLNEGMDPNCKPTSPSIPLDKRHRNLRRDTPCDKVEERTSLLYFAAKEGHEAVVRVLLEKGADTSIGTPLRHAMENGHDAVVRLLLLHGADWDIEQDGPSMLLKTARDGHVGVVEILLEKGVPLDLTHSEDTHPLFVAILYNHIEVVEFLLNKGVSPNFTNKHGTAALSLAAQTESKGMVGVFIQYGCQVNTVDRLGRGPLFFASLCGTTPIVKALLQHGELDSKAMTSAGRSPLSVAHDLNHSEIVRILRSASGEPVSHEEPVKDHSERTTRSGICCICESPIPDGDQYLGCAECHGSRYNHMVACVECVVAGVASCDVGHKLETMTGLDSYSRIFPSPLSNQNLRN